MQKQRPSPTDEASVSGGVAGRWIIPIKIQKGERSRADGMASEEGKEERRGGGMKITRCAGNDRKYKPGEISQAGNIPVRRRSTNTRDCSTPLYPLPPFFYPAALFLPVSRTGAAVVFTAA